ncbi:alpha/beta-hydrolase [Ophiobolus disseminans]|uniref:Kynurenine formamidase n=1 Tax=Ophiobolus disseminans TaxID=1469910 RepID=A0A6A7AJ81_9PLEO|nr:alpha/beta-hydrolase [Ophiobolus disseminans]
MTPTEYPKHIPSIPYSDSPSRLQTLDIWLPRPLVESDPANSLWIIYMHGGAWRDPTQTSLCAEPTIKHLLSKSPFAIAGIATLNYRLSPYASHATDPSSPTDADRNVTHPTHIRDVAQGIAFLQKKYGVKKWIGIGHSCGATLLCQYVSGIGAVESDNSGGPEALILTAGIYSIPLFLRNHSAPACPPNIAQIYVDIVAGAFGADSAVYHGVSPVAGKYDTEKWKNGKLVVLAHSYDDELVERAQRDVMCVALDREGWSIVMEDGDDEADVSAGRRVLEVRDIKGSHDFVWEDGGQSAKLIVEVVERLTSGAS